MMKRKRQTYGVAFDPTPEEDIAWDEEYSSADYDSDDQHSVADGILTSDDSTDDEAEEWRVTKKTVEVNVDQSKVAAALRGEKEDDDTGKSALPYCYICYRVEI